jgi:hypothetical protein
MRALAITLLLVGCGYDYENEAHDVGTLRMAPWNQPEPPSDLETWGPLWVSPLAPLDFTSSSWILVQAEIPQCEHGEASCNVVRFGRDFLVKSSFAWDETCFTREVHYLRTTCAIAPLDAGTYRVHYGDKTAELEIPQVRTMIEIDTGLNR